jgi:hypothetical protein
MKQQLTTHESVIYLLIMLTMLLKKPVAVV